ncbi:glycosyltransferase family 4 protein [Ensifer adhaerens]|uniref:glycosyltransferase family 4 protein n=1 Tax=Ensifer adhaerens TaxID=106592 RepID=UPI0013AF05F2|nr:glycosyltransferase family 1 protein [Ensifer adhaerens]MBW0365453.1 glycosyltransferase family 4 protein [Ensifer adhaerens]UCM22787.1 glycosyltransferase family 4 protein [Ensifer adhaerens]
MTRSLLVDGKNLSLRNGTGVANYARSLCGNLQAMGHRVELLYGQSADLARGDMPPEVQFFDDEVPRRRPPFLVRYADRMARAFFAATPEPVHFARSALSLHHQQRLPLADAYWNARDVFDLPGAAVRAGRFQHIRNIMNVDIAHWTYPVPVHLEGAINIYTLHDLVPLKLPDTTLDNKRVYFEMVRRIVNTADLIVTVSRQSKQDIHEIFNVPEDRVVNTYQDVDIPQQFFDETEDDVADAIEGIYGLRPGRFMLFVGAVEPKKNVGRLIEAHLASGLDMPLVIAGKDGWLVENELQLFRQHIERCQGQPRVIRLPYVPRRQLINLIRGACAVTFPSIYEGFGLPIVEAMLCGTPVLTSNFGAMREIAGEAALLINPYDSASIRDGLRRLAGDAALRDELKAAGRERATLFSSAAYRTRLADAYAMTRPR